MKGLDTHLYHCQTCRVTFESLQALKSHFDRSRVHSNDDPFTKAANSDSYCLHCRRQFPSSKKLLHHFSLAHKSDVVCSICNAQFRKAAHLKAHMASPVHNERDIPCPHCHKLFKTTSGVAHHLEYKCLKKVTEAVVQWDTNYMITNQRYTNRIQEVYHDDEYDDEFTLTERRDQGLMEVLDVLVTADTWDVAAQAYVCPVIHCHTGFRQLHGLNQHLGSQVHRTDPDTFRCPGCQARFPVVSALIQHLESGVCGLVKQQMVKEIYTGLHDMFQRLLKI